MLQPQAWPGNWGLLELQAGQRGPLWEGRTNFLQHSGLTKPQQQ